MEPGIGKRTLLLILLGIITFAVIVGFFVFRGFKERSVAQVYKASDTALREVNAPRGRIISVSNDRFVIENEEEKQITIPYSAADTELSCVDDNWILPTGENFSLYDSYINISGLKMDRNHAILSGESPISFSTVEKYLLEGNVVQAIYATKDTPSVVKGEVKAKIVFLSCMSI